MKAAAGVVAVVLFVLSVSPFLASAKTQWHQLNGYTFLDYQKEFNKQYRPGEWDMRRHIFEARLANIQAHNRDDTKMWKEGVNHLTDRTDAELKSLRGLRKQFIPSVPVKADKFSTLSTTVLPDRVDWREKGIVTPVKDQGQCGSCWTFATAETIESHWALANGGQLPVLSEQQILDCTPNPNQCGGTGGCGGGTAELAMQQIINMGGLSSEWTYSYNSYYGAAFTCKFSNSTPPAAKIRSFVKLPENVFDPLMIAVAHIGPIAISVDASSWSNYESGVYNGCNQSNPDIDHAVQLVGYGTDPIRGDYWLVRNSWSPAWGEDGYIRLWRTPKVICGTDTHPSDGTGCRNGPPTVRVCGTCGILYDNSYPII